MIGNDGGGGKAIVRSVVVGVANSMMRHNCWEYVRCLSKCLDEMKLRATHDFKPIQMKYRETEELGTLLVISRLLDFSYLETIPFKKDDILEIIFPPEIE